MIAPRNGCLIHFTVNPIRAGSLLTSCYSSKNGLGGMRGATVVNPGERKSQTEQIKKKRKSVFTENE